MEEKDMSIEDIQNKITELANEIARLSCYILKKENCMAVKLDLSIINVLGMCKVHLDSSTTTPGDMDVLGKALGEMTGIPTADPADAPPDAPSVNPQEEVENMLKDLRKPDEK